MIIAIPRAASIPLSLLRDGLGTPAFGPGAALPAVVHASCTRAATAAESPFKGEFMPVSFYQEPNGRCA
jgi:hypothetical protein